MRVFYYLLCSGSLLVAGCTKSNVSPTDQLPPATQTGANTFGCLLNGKTFLPNGGGLGMPNYSVIYEPDYRKGQLSISASRYTKEGDPDSRQSLTIVADSVQAPGHYPLNRRFQEGLFSDRRGCNFYSEDPRYRVGELILTRADKARGIISGTFHFTLYQPGCDSVIVTQGRFDKQL